MHVFGGIGLDPIDHQRHDRSLLSGDRIAIIGDHGNQRGRVYGSFDMGLRWSQSSQHRDVQRRPESVSSGAEVGS